MTISFFMEEIAKSVLDFLKKQGFGTFVITVVAIFFWYRAEAYELKMETKTTQLEAAFEKKIATVESSLQNCETERETLALSVTKLEARFNAKFKR